MDQTRRAVLAGFGAGLGVSAIAPPATAATLPRSIQRHQAFQPWKVMIDPDPVPLAAPVTLLDGRTVPLSQYIGKTPVIITSNSRCCRTSTASHGPRTMRCR